jgi:hypothetical protein
LVLEVMTEGGRVGLDWNDDLWVSPVVPVGGVLRPSEIPGHGLRFRPEGLTEHRVGGFELLGR